MAPNNGTSEVEEASDTTLDRIKNQPEILMVELPLGRVDEEDGLSEETHSPCALLAAPQNRHKMAASWIFSAQNGQFTVSSLSCPSL